ncbi:MAG: cobyric acid synthase [Chloroflexi bacterium]|nr:cobyric acid synthase [Chloroflexota bacterium]
MVQGTASSVGKTVLVAGLCRYFVNRDLRVAPFKSQNMALNSFATADGREIGRAQAMQALACRIPPRVEMNPILLKPEADHRSQVVLMGKVHARLEAAEYYREKPKLLPVVCDALQTLRSEYDVVVIEGAGSPAEVNLQAHDIVNMRVADIADAPVLLAGDIDRGGVFASLLGTLELLPPQHQERVKALVVNKFRGDRALLQPGLEFIAERTGKPILGVVPWLRDLGLPEEDSVALVGLQSRGPIAVVRLPHIANFDDFDPLPIRYVERPEELVGAPAIILPGTKSTMADLAWLRRTGLAEAIETADVPVVGICGGLQMMGLTIRDPLHSESEIEEARGLGLLPIETLFAAKKTTVQTRASTVRGGYPLHAYQIHMGQTISLDGARPFARLESGEPDGAVKGHNWGTYLHGVFHNAQFRRAWLATLGLTDGPEPDDPFDRLAAELEQALDLPLLHRIVGL